MIGVGVNTRMSLADLPVETATSFAASGLEVDEDRLLAAFLTELDAQLTALLAAGGDAGAAGVAADIVALCSTVGSDVDVALPDGSHLVGRADGIDAEGRLVVVADGVPTPVAAGDVVHVR